MWSDLNLLPQNYPLPGPILIANMCEFCDKGFILNANFCISQGRELRITLCGKCKKWEEVVGSGTKEIRIGLNNVFWRFVLVVFI